MSLRCIKVRTRRCSFTTGDNCFASRFQSCYQSFEPEEQLWALAQIPLRGIPNGTTVERECFQYFCNHLNPNDEELVQSLQHAIGRELQTPILEPTDHLHHILPIIKTCIDSDVPGTWTKMLHTIGKKLKDPSDIAAAYDHVSRLMHDPKRHSSAAAAHLIKGLCAGGSVIPNALITALLAKPDVVEECYYPFLMSVLANFTPTAAQLAIDQVLRESTSHAGLLGAVLRLPNIPATLVHWANMIITTSSEKTEIVCEIVKNRERIVSLGILTETSIVNLLWQSCLFTPKFYRVAAEYLYKAIDKIAEKDSLMILQRICQSNSPHSLKLIRKFVQTPKSPQSIEYIVSFLTKKPQFVNFDEWVKTIGQTLPVVPDNLCDHLTECLASALENEVNTGHVCARSGKRIVPDGEPKVRKSDGPVRVKGWREISLLITTISQSHSIWILRSLGPKLLRAALDVHSYPIIPSVVTFLKVISPTAEDDVISLLLDLLGGNSLKQKIAMKIVPEMTCTHKLLSRVGIEIARLALESEVMDVKCAALRTIPLLAKWNEFYNTRIPEISLAALEEARLSNDRQMEAVLRETEDSYNEFQKHVRVQRVETPQPKAATIKRISERKPRETQHGRRHSENTDGNAPLAEKAFKPQSFLVRPYVKRPSLTRSRRGNTIRRPSAPISARDWLD